MRTVLACAVMIATFLAPAAGHAKAPRRPIVGDANSALAYYRLGLEEIERRPEAAADA